MRPQDLVEGGCYFSVGFHADERFLLQVPYIEAVGFESVMMDEDGPKWIFSYAADDQRRSRNHGVLRETGHALLRERLVVRAVGQ